MAKKITYKNHCTPQEKINFSSGNRWYLDSDIGRKLTGTVDLTVTTITDYDSALAITTTPTGAITDGHKFIFVRNNGENDIVMCLDRDAGTPKYYIKLSKDESFASKIKTTAKVGIKTVTGTSTVEYLTGT